VENRLTGFYGQYRTTLDDKGRFALPAKLRAATSTSKEQLLDSSIVLTKGLEGCLSLYPEEEWSEIQKRLSSLSFTQKNFRYFSRRFYSAASIVSPDKNGRILIPSHLIEEAHLKKELLVIGVNRWIEVWDPDRYMYYLEQFAGSYEEVAERLFVGNDQQSE